MKIVISSFYPRCFVATPPCSGGLLPSSAPVSCWPPRGVAFSKSHPGQPFHGTSAKLATICNNVSSTIESTYRNIQHVIVTPLTELLFCAIRFLHQSSLSFRFTRPMSVGFFSSIPCFTVIVGCIYGPPSACCSIKHNFCSPCRVKTRPTPLHHPSFQERDPQDPNV